MVKTSTIATVLVGTMILIVVIYLVTSRIHNRHEMHHGLTMLHGDLMKEYPEQLMAHKHINGDDCVLELGGNVGTTSLVVNNKLNRKDYHVVVEPGGTQHLEANRDHNNAGFQICGKAVSQVPLMIKGWVSRPVPAQGVTDGWKAIETQTVEDLKAQYNLPFNVLVADCEGCLVPMIVDNPNLLVGITKIILEHDFPTEESHRGFLALMDSNGFTMIDSYKKTDEYGPGMNWEDGLESDPIFVSVWTRGWQ